MKFYRIKLSSHKACSELELPHLLFLFLVSDTKFPPSHLTNFHETYHYNFTVDSKEQTE